jgi:hypothetical protein
MNGAGDTFVGKGTIAKGVSLRSVRAVDTAINRLEAAGYLGIRRSRGGRPNHYVAQTPHRHAGSTPHRDAGSNPASDDTEPRISRHQTPHGGAPESEVLESEVQSVDGDEEDELEELLKPVGHLYPAQRSAVVRAYAENPAGVSRCVRKALAGERPAALLASMIREQAHLQLEKLSGKHYTGVRFVRGQTSGTFVYDPLGTEKLPPGYQGWPHDPPTGEEIARAQRGRHDEESEA